MKTHPESGAHNGPKKDALGLFSLFFVMSGVGKYAGRRKTNSASSKMQMRYNSGFYILSIFDSFWGF